ncbi:MAG: DUF4230 domain-containing protein [Bacteroidales bacterium]|nr:DUF4230 domain-containing protein [Bacteroidales bacterium]
MKFQIKLILIIIGIVAIVVATLYISHKLSGEDKLEIEETPNVVDVVKEIHELCTEYYYDEKLITHTKKTTSGAGGVVNSIVDFFSSNNSQGVSQSELSIIAKVTIRLGYNLEEMANDSSFRVNGDTLTIKLPKAQILDTIVNPSDCLVFVEDGSWKLDELKAIVSDAKQEASKDAVANDMFAKAEESGRKTLTNLFSTMGFVVLFE